MLLCHLGCIFIPSVDTCTPVVVCQNERNLNWRASKLNRWWKYMIRTWDIVVRSSHTIYVESTTQDYSFDFPWCDSVSAVLGDHCSDVGRAEKVPKHSDHEKNANCIRFNEIHCLQMSTWRRHISPTNRRQQKKKKTNTKVEALHVDREEATK